MSEGPQVRLRTEWLRRHLAGREVLEARSDREALDPVLPLLPGRRVHRCFCKGKHIFIDFGDGLFLHNHLLMRGRWRRLDGRLLFLPPGCWLSLGVGAFTVVNINGQVLRPLDAAGVKAVLASLGPDVLDDPLPAEDILAAIRRCCLPVSEALLDQAVVSGIGNVARSEALFLARVHPAALPGRLAGEDLRRVVGAVARVVRDSYREGGRWRHRVYGRRGLACEDCGAAIRSLRLKPSRRTVYFCPRCQSARNVVL